MPTVKYTFIQGQRFGRLIVVSIHKVKNKKGVAISKWMCKCDCGSMHAVIPSYLMRGITQSCGCYQKDCTRKRRSLPVGEGAKRIVFRHYQRQARRRGLHFELTMEQACLFFRSECAYCGASPSNKAQHPDGNGGFVYNGIDRLDNNVGYIWSNCVPCCKMCNMCKKDIPLEKFIAHIKRIHLYYTERWLNVSQP